MLPVNDPVVPPLPSCKVPKLIVEIPEKELLPESVVVPAAFLVKVPVPLITPA